VDHSTDFIPPTFDDSTWANAPQLLYIETSSLSNTEGFTKATPLPADTTNSNRPFNTTYFRTHFSYNGPLNGVVLRATVMIDDGAIFYLNGTELIPASGNRLRMPAGPIDFTTIATGTVGNATVEMIAFPATALVNGDNVLCVEVHQEHDPGTQTSSDITFGMKLDAQTSTSAGAGDLVINEFLPINATLQNPNGSFAGWIELFNPSAAAIDISDMGLSDNTAVPRKFVFPAGSTIAGGGYLVIYCDPSAPASATNTGFALPALGGGVYLFEKTAAGGGLHDAVTYGLQVADFGIGRTPNGTGAFALTVPTRGALNSAAGIAPLAGVKLNEWLASPTSGPGFFELYNTAAQPVPIGGAYLTDLLSNRTKYLIPPLSFIGGSGISRWRQFIADNDASAAAGHVNFSLNQQGESLGIFSGAGVQLDAVTFGPQVPGVSQGHLPDGSSSAVVALTPTPGAPNAPAAPDADGDGIPDAWEIANGTNPNASDATLDPDGDGADNRSEYLAGTNPHQPGSRLSAVVIATGVPGRYAVRFNAVAGKTYTVRYKANLGISAWLKIADVPAQASDTVIDVPDDGSAGQPARFYQVVTPAQP
jgi:hypothetical protein